MEYINWDVYLILIKEPKQYNLKWGWSEVTQVDGDSECSVCGSTIQLQKINMGFRRQSHFQQ